MLEMNGAATEVIGADEFPVAAAPAASPLLNTPLTASDLATIASLLEKMICEVQVGYRETREEAERRVHGWMRMMGNGSANFIEAAARAARYGHARVTASMASSASDSHRVPVIPQSRFS